MEAICELYTIEHDCIGKGYLGIDLDWDHAAKLVHLSMLDYVKEALICFGHLPPTHPHDKTDYGQRIQYSEEEDNPHQQG